MDTVNRPTHDSAPTETASHPPGYHLVEGWEQLPAGFVHGDVADVAVDTDDYVYMVTRREPRVIVYDSAGRFQRSWGEGLFSERPHAITVGRSGAVYVVDESLHVVRKFSKRGELLASIGTPGQAADTGIDPSIKDLYGRLQSIKYGGPPFNLPTKVAEAPSGDLYITDGYGNCRVHHFTAEGVYLHSWGEPGAEPGQFYAPHCVVVTDDERVLVCDRENERIQIFTPDGRFLEQWLDVQRPSGLVFDSQGFVYVTELPWRVGNGSFRRGRISEPHYARVSVLDARGRALEHWGNSDACAPGSFVAPHGIAVDSRGSLYIADVTWSFAGQMGLVPDDCHTFHKFECTF